MGHGGDKYGYDTSGFDDAFILDGPQENGIPVTLIPPSVPVPSPFSTHSWHRVEAVGTMSLTLRSIREAILRCDANKAGQEKDRLAFHSPLDRSF